MLATVLKTPVADSISMKIIDAFVYMRKYISNDLIRNNDILGLAKWFNVLSNEELKRMEKFGYKA